MDIWPIYNLWTLKKKGSTCNKDEKKLQISSLNLSTNQEHLLLFQTCTLGSENMVVAIVENWDQQGMLKVFPDTTENAYLIFHWIHL